MTIDSTGSLNIHSLKTTDRGLYVCQVNNEVGQTKQQFQADVYGKNLKKSRFSIKMKIHFILIAWNCSGTVEANEVSSWEWEENKLLRLIRCCSELVMLLTGKCNRYDEYVLTSSDLLNRLSSILVKRKSRWSTKTNMQKSAFYTLRIKLLINNILFLKFSSIYKYDIFFS